MSAFKPALNKDYDKIPFKITPNERWLIKLLKKVANGNSNKSKDLALKYYHMILDKYGDLATTEIFKSYVCRINKKYGLHCPLPN